MSWLINRQAVNPCLLLFKTRSSLPCFPPNAAACLRGPCQLRNRLDVPTPEPARRAKRRRPMEFTSSYLHAFGNPDFAAVFSSGDCGGSAQARRPLPSAVDDAARVKAPESRGSPAAARHGPSVFCVPDMYAEEAHHFLDQCTFCHKALCGDIFMYRSAK
jgi:hypothetical protein